MPRKLAVVVSDLHLGRGNLQDDFVRDDDFAGFCRELNDYGLRNDLDLTLVLNGDIVDLWELATDAELEDDAAEEIRRNLHFPLARGDAAGRAAAEAYFAARIRDALHSHFLVSASLSRLLERERNRVVYLMGNHDHPMCSPELQRAFRELVGEHSGGGEARVDFAQWFRDDDLRLYVEHGHQFSAGESAYRDPGAFEKEAPGYYFLRYVWNRIQARSPRPESEAVGALIKVVLRHVLLGDDRTAELKQFRYLQEYFAAHREGAVPVLAENAGLPDIFQEWREDGEVSATEAALKAAKSRLAEVFKKSHAKREPRFRRRAPTADEGGPYPIRDIALRGRQRDIGLRERLVDGYWTGAMGRFERSARRFPKLDPARTSTVVLGHTHRRLLYELPVKGGKGVRYWNCGAWARGPAASYFWVTNDGDPLEWRGIKEV